MYQFSKYLSQTEKAYKEPYQASKMKRLVKIVNGWNPLSITAKHSISDVWQDSEYVSAVDSLYLEPARSSE